MRAWPSSSDRQMGDDFAKIGDFQMRTLRLVVFLHKTFPRCARGLCHLIENGGGELADIRDFQRRKSSLFLKLSALRTRPLSLSKIN